MLLNFCQKFRPIFASLSPNTEEDDIRLVSKLIVRPQEWKNEEAIEKLEKGFVRYLGVRHAFAFNSGRSALLAILSALDLEQGSEVLLQGFTCNAAVNPIIWSNLKPVFVDIKHETLNIDSQDLERKITENSRVVMVQHTFGLPAEIDRILEICQKHGSIGSPQDNLILIEDCAHSLGATFRGQKVGTFGKAAFFSFGRDKIISSVYGGMAVTNDDELAQKIKVFRDNLDYPSYFWIFQQLLHPILTNFLIIPLYGLFGIGRWVLGGLQKVKILSKAVDKKEKQGQKPFYIPQKMPNALAMLALHQFGKLDKFINHQKQAANFYDKNFLRLNLGQAPKNETGRIYMRYPVLLKEHETDTILRQTRKQKIFLDDGWRKAPIVPPDTNQEKMGYIWGTCPVAERVAKVILSLPTHINISQRDKERIIESLESCFE